jgi:hypothetical protein
MTATRFRSIDDPARWNVDRPHAEGEDADRRDDSRLLATKLIAGLDSWPFRPTAAQLAWVWGGELVMGEAQESRSRIAAGRYAALFTVGEVSSWENEGGAAS